MRVFSALVRVLLIGLIAGGLLWLACLNLRLYKPGRTETAYRQLRFLAQSLESGGAERMQVRFPEGYVFTWALYGLASAQVAQALPPSDPRREESFRAIQNAIAHVDSDQARRTFDADMKPRYGAFYSAWSLYLRSKALLASGKQGPACFDLDQYKHDCDSFASALSESATPFLSSYPEAAWPVDTAVGVAALAIHDRLLEGRYHAIIQTWISEVKQRLVPGLGAISHAAHISDGRPLRGARGSSLALLCVVLADVDPSLARGQFEILRSNFVAYSWGVPGVREYPHGHPGKADIDSGPIIFGFSGPATVVGAGAAIVNGDEDLTTALLATAEMAGFPIEIGGRRKYALGLLPVGDAFLAWARSSPSTSQPGSYISIIPKWWRLPIHTLSLVLGIAAVLLAIRLIRLGRLKVSTSRQDTANSPGRKQKHE